MTPDEIKELVKYYDVSILTKSELEIRLHQKLLNQYLDRIEDVGKPTGHFSMGAFVGPFKYKFCISYEKY